MSAWGLGRRGPSSGSGAPEIKPNAEPEPDWKAIAERYREMVLDVGSPDPSPFAQWGEVPAYWLAARRDLEAEWPS